MGATDQSMPGRHGSRVQTLGRGVNLPYLGFGTDLISDSEAPVAVHAAIKARYRHIDTAEFYGNEAGVSEGVRRALKSAGLSRSDLFVTTKLWPGNAAWGQTLKTSETTIVSLDESLQRLGLDYASRQRPCLRPPRPGPCAPRFWAATLTVLGEARPRPRAEGGFTDLGEARPPNRAKPAHDPARAEGAASTAASTVTATILPAHHGPQPPRGTMLRPCSARRSSRRSGAQNHRSLGALARKRCLRRRRGQPLLRLRQLCRRSRRPPRAARRGRPGGESLRRRASMGGANSGTSRPARP